MNKTHFDAYFDHMLNEVRETRDAGQKEYAHTEENVFANFDRIGKSIDTISDKVLMIYLLLITIKFPCRNSCTENNYK